MLDRYEEFKARILEVTDSQLIQEVDGFYYYFPKDGGFITSDGLRVIADELDRRNREWNEYINEHLPLAVEHPHEQADGWRDYGVESKRTK